MRNRYVLLADLPLVGVAAWAAFTARFDWEFYTHRPEFLPFLLAALAIKPIVFVLVGMYRRYWRYTSIQDLAVVLTAVTASSAVMAMFVGIGVGRMFDEFSRVVLVNDWLMTLAAAGGFRVALRVVHDTRTQGRRTRQVAGAQRILIVGAGAAGTMVAREMRRNPQLGMIPAGFLDDDRIKIGKHLAGLPVIGPTAALREVVREQEVDSVVIAMPSAQGRTVRAILNMCNDAGVKSQTIPGVYELLNGQVGVNRLRNVDIADLLRRNPVDGGCTITGFLADRVVLITGAGGSIGSELARQIANARPARLALVGHGENSLFDAEAALKAEFPHIRLTCIVADIRDVPRLATVFDRVRPEIVFHAAAHKHVPLMEDNPEEAVTNNIIGTRNVVEQALRVGTERFVLISTDKAVAPTSIMGASKRIAEGIVRQAATRSGRAFVAVRFGNVLGSRGSVVNTFKKQIEQGGPVTVTDAKMKRFFMTIPEAVHLVLQASGHGRGGELFVLDMGEPILIVDLARDLIKLSGLTEDDIPIVVNGIRPGEKLEEHLFDPGMQTRPTAHPEVLEVAGADAAAGPALDDAVRRLAEAAVRGDRVTIDAVFAELIPGFRPSARPWDMPALDSGSSCS